MKKYVKPEMFYERFELSQHIADCAWELTQGDKNTCAAKPDLNFGNGALAGLPPLFTDTKICTMTEENFDWYCYHNGAEGFPNTFAS